MAENTTTVARNQFDEDKARAFAYINEKGWKSERMLVTRAMVDPEVTDEERADYLFTYTPGWVRRGFRQAALILEKEGNEDLAEVFWALRDDIDPYTGEWFTMNQEEVA